MLRVRPVGGRSTPRGCGWRWPRMTRCCVRRLRRTAVGCSSTPVTGCVPRSPRRARAVDAAVAAQRALELPVRMGIATGEAELRDGDYFGAALNRAARVMAAGHGGQVLLAESTAGLLSGVDLVDLGPRRLRDLPTAGRGVPGPSDRVAGGLSGRCGRWMRVRESAAPDHELHRTRVRSRRGASGGQSSSVGDVDRCRRGRQDPAGVRGRGASRR